MAQTDISDEKHFAKKKKRPKDCPYDEWACRVYHFCGRCPLSIKKDLKMNIAELEKITN